MLKEYSSNKLWVYSVKETKHKIFLFEGYLYQERQLLLKITKCLYVILTNCFQNHELAF